MKIQPLIFIALAILILTFLLTKQSQNSEIKYGVNFDQRYAKYLGVDPELLLDEILNDLQIKNFRLSAYWSLIEPEKGKFDFNQLDLLIDKIAKKDGKVILSVGRKLPRWPECHAPSWAIKLPEKEQQELVLKYLEETVKRYQNNPVVYAIQVENEPFMEFGICPPLDRQFLQQEIDLVRLLSEKPIIITDSGEVRPWVSPAKLSDILGISLYRTVNHPKFGNINYPLIPSVYNLKYRLVKKLFAPKSKKVIITELQAEAWVTDGAKETPIDIQIKNFPAKSLKGNTEFAQKTSFSDIYFWGAEWWYYMKQNDHPEYWEYIKSLSLEI